MCIRPSPNQTITIGGFSLLYPPPTHVAPRLPQVLFVLRLTARVEGFCVALLGASSGKRYSHARGAAAIGADALLCVEKGQRALRLTLEDRAIPMLKRWARRSASSWGRRSRTCCW